MASSPISRSSAISAGPNQAQQAYTWSKLGYQPLPLQQPFHLCRSRFRLLAGGEGSGKSRLGAMELASRMWWGDRFWVVGARYEDCRPEFDYILEAAHALGAVQSVTYPQDGQCVLRLSTGTIIETIPSADEAKLARYGVDGCLMVEAARQSYEAYLRLRGRVARTGGWLFLTGTFEGSLGWYPDLYTAWQAPDAAGESFSLPTWANTILYPGGRQDPEILALEASMTRERFTERHSGQPVPPAGRVLTPFSVLRNVRAMEYDEMGGPVELAIDPGYAGAYAVEFVQVVGRQLRVLDEVYDRGLITEEVIELCRASPLWPLVRGGVVDVAARQHQAAPAVIQVWWKETQRDKGGGLRLRSQRVEVEPGIERLRSLMAPDPAVDGEPRLLVHPQCRAFLGEAAAGPHPLPGMGPWVRKTDSSGNVIGPPEDRNDHAAQALIYYAVDRFGYAGRVKGSIVGAKFRNVGTNARPDPYEEVVFKL